MKPWSAFYPYILIYLPGCPYPVVDQALLLASMEYFDKSLAWKEWLDPVQTLAGVNEYDFEIDTRQQEIVQLCTATTDGEDLPLALPGELPPDWQTQYDKPGNSALWGAAGQVAESLKNMDGLTAIEWSVGLLHKFVWSKIPANVAVGPASASARCRPSARLPAPSIRWAAATS
jgi:hypothetical protein